MYKAYKYRIYPTPEQAILMEKHFGCVRFIYNLALETKIEAYKRGVNLTCYDLQRQVTDLKKDCDWLNEISRNSIDKTLERLDKAYKSFFNGRGFPTFKSKKNDRSFTVHQDLSLKDKLHIPKFQKGIDIVLHRPVDGKIKRVTILKTSTGKYYASLLVETELTSLPKLDNIIGIDLGIKTFAVTSDGKEYASPNFLRKSLDRLAVLQRRASKKKKGSANRRKANLRVAILHERISNQRKDFLHKVSHEITNHNGTICIENLNVKGMVKNHNLALSISDASWSEFTRQLVYKSQWRGRDLITIGRFEATSKTCSNCGNKKDMPLSERVYNCSCGLSIDRDLNAAINIKNSGILRAVEPVELPTLVGAVRQEKCVGNHANRSIKIYKNDK